MKIFTGLKSFLETDFKIKYWLIVFAVAVLLALHGIAKSATSQTGFLKYIQDFLPEAVSAGIGAMIAVLISDYRNKKIKLKQHVIYPVISGTVLFFAILLFGGVFSKVEIRICGNGDGQFSRSEIQMINDDLAKVNKNIKVSLVMNYNELARLSKEEPHSVNVNKIFNYLTKQVKSGKGKCDIYELDVIWIPHFAEEGWIIPLDRYREKSDVQYTFGIEQQLCKVVYKKGKKTIVKQSFAVPNFLNVGFLMYRVDLFHELIGKDREPTTWNELVEWLDEINEKYGDQYDGFVFQGDQYEGLLVNFMEILWALGGEIHEENGIPQVNTPEALGALNFFKKLLKDGIVPREVLSYNEVSSLEHFRQGKTLVLRNWPRAFYSFQNHKRFKKLRNRVDVMSKPLSFKGIARASAKMSLGGWYYAISREAYETGKAEQTMEIIEHLTSEKQFTEYMYPSQFSENKTEYSIRIAADQTVLENVKGSKDALDYAYRYFKNRFYRARPKFKYYPVFSEILVKHIHRSLENPGLNAEQALKNAQEELNKVISEINNG